MAATQQGATTGGVATGGAATAASAATGDVLLCVWCARYGRPASAARVLTGSAGTSGAAWVAVPHAQARALRRLPTTSHGMCPWCASQFAAEWDLPLVAPAIREQDECPAGPPAAPASGPMVAPGMRGRPVGAWARLAAATFLVGSTASLAHVAALVVFGYVGSLLCLSTAWLACRDDGLLRQRV